MVKTSGGYYNHLCFLIEAWQGAATGFAKYGLESLGIRDFVAAPVVPVSVPIERRVRCQNITGVAGA